VQELRDQDGVLRDRVEPSRLRAETADSGKSTGDVLERDLRRVRIVEIDLAPRSGVDRMCLHRS
jgi:hypothetical protein